ncbi:hypothetical protein BJX61DRAFT_70284 [Aspergillus egyptiacus]|nr:hypothetical protein BJX61DRAFT_70284 [Aspergillus egyptiacus]
MITIRRPLSLKSRLDNHRRRRKVGNPIRQPSFGRALLVIYDQSKPPRLDHAAEGLLHPDAQTNSNLRQSSIIANFLPEVAFSPGFTSKAWLRLRVLLLSSPKNISALDVRSVRINLSEKSSDGLATERVRDWLCGGEQQGQPWPTSPQALY